MEERKYTKLATLAEEHPEFTVEKVFGFNWEQWEDGKMKRDAKWFEGANKTWGMATSEGILNVSKAQFSNMLEACFAGEGAKIVGTTFTVKTNGKDGQDRRYYINVVRDVKPAETVAEEAPAATEPVDLPF